MANLQFRKSQAGLETTRGTAVAATRRLYNGSEFNPNLNYRRLEAPGSGSRIPMGNIVGGIREIPGTHEDQLTAQDAPWYFQLGIKGGVAGALVGTAGAWSYTFVPSGAADDMRTATFEWNPGDEAGTNVFRLPGTYMESWGVDWSVGDEASFTSTLRASDMITAGGGWTALTPALAERPRTVLGGNRPVRVYLDTASAIGTTELLGRSISYTLSYDNARHYKVFGESPTTVQGSGLGELDITASIQLEWSTRAQYDAFMAGTDQKLRVRFEGPTITGAAPAAIEYVEFDHYGQWTSHPWSDREGNITSTMDFTLEYNTTAAQMFSAKVVNGLSTLP